MKIQTRLFVVIPVLICIFLSACSSVVECYDDTDIPTFTAITGIKLGEIDPPDKKGGIFSAYYPCTNLEERSRSSNQYIEYLTNQGWVVTQNGGSGAILEKGRGLISILPVRNEDGSVFVGIIILPGNT